MSHQYHYLLIPIEYSTSTSTRYTFKVHFAFFCSIKYEGSRVPREVCLLREASHVPGVIRLLDFHVHAHSYVLVLERPPCCQDLFDLVTARGRLEEPLARSLLRQVVKVILALRQRGIVHGDIKDENILVRKCCKQFYLFPVYICSATFG